MATAREAEAIVDKLARDLEPDGASNSKQRQTIDDQFARKLASLEDSGDAPAELIVQLRTLWRMFQAPEGKLPWQERALVMVALGYFVAPLDMIPDVAGKMGYMDDRMIVAIVHRRLGESVHEFVAE